MRALLNIAILSLATTHAVAQAADFTVPEPGVMGLLGIGVLALLIAHRGKK